MRFVYRCCFVLSAISGLLPGSVGRSQDSGGAVPTREPAWNSRIMSYSLLRLKGVHKQGWRALWVIPVI